MLFSKSICLSSNLRSNSCFRDSIPLAKYLPNTFENDIYLFWNQKEFSPRKNGDKFSMLLPPPNVTGTLHLGHALTVTVQDTIARWKRMCGSNVQWVPGMDHAGIATQAVVEKALERNGLSRLSIGRRKFIEEVWKWKDLRGSVINEQLMKLGSSVDWSREYFTLDKKQSEAVVEALSILWSKNLVYRDETLVNWSPNLSSTISDIEVNNVEINTPIMISIPGYDKPIEFGKIVDFAYKIVGSDDEMVVSTTRVETISGDVAVAVNPEDERYSHLRGSFLIHPFSGSKLPLVFDSNVDPTFGTGAVKITPAHDKADFLMSKIHKLPLLSVINENGVLINSGQFSGMKRYDAREAILNALAEKGLLRGIRPHKMTLPLCSRSGDVIEFLIKPQWFLKCSEMSIKAISAIKEKRIVIRPEKYGSVWIDWLENIQDWCISRQLWWGHQVPFYRAKQNEGVKEVWFLAKSLEAAQEIARNTFPDSVTVNRDTDVLDTWFSSALLPFSCFGWPDTKTLLQKYYPLDILVTGNDILFFWVSRMLMLGLELTDQIPFKKVLLHGIICDSQGKKMSKSIGNVIDPVDIIEGKSLDALIERIETSFLSDDELTRAKNELKKNKSNGIPEYGVDALRFTLLSSNLKSQFINFDLKECDGAKRFCNKLFQVCKFTNKWCEKVPMKDPLILDFSSLQNIMNKWIILRFFSVVDSVNNSLCDDDFHIASSSLRNFIHHDFCDIYVESIKPIILKSEADKKEILHILLFVLKSCLKCLHPFIPFLTEQLYHSFPESDLEKSILEEDYPSSFQQGNDSSVLENVSFALKVVGAIRRLKHTYGLGENHTSMFMDNPLPVSDIKGVIEALARCTIYYENISNPEIYKFETINEDTRIFLDLRECSPVNLRDKQMMAKNRNNLEKNLNKLLKMTSNAGYEQVPSKIKKSHQEKILKLRSELENIELMLKDQEVKL